MPNVLDIAKENIGIITAGAAGLAIGGAVGYATGRKSRKKRSSKRRTSSSRRKTSHRKRKRYTPRTAGKGKDRSTRRIRYTKRGQPYILLKNGKARFIKMSSARNSHKRKGGRY